MSGPTSRVIDGLLAPDGGPGSAPPSFAELRGRKRLLLEEQSRRWQEGDPAPPEAFLRRWPTDPEGDPDVASLLFADLLQRRLHGEEASDGEYTDRYPDQEQSLARLISRQALLRSTGGASDARAYSLRLPVVGEEVFGFRLRAELGRGAFAQVFLAEQADLAGRLVALKVSAIEGTEPQTLAQLQHTHIVPIYSVHEDARAGLRAVCMPYFGGASLFQVMKQLWHEQGVPLHGRQLVEALAAVGGPPPAGSRGPDGAEGPARPASCVLAGLPYVQAAAWIVARLAEGLQHAHQRGVLHRDVKPSNVLLGADGQPMLLDFNVSQDQHTDPTEAMLGGTVAYMAPEHLRAIVGSSPALNRLVDHRADIYSLGMVLFEILTGHRPFDQSGSYSTMPLQIEAMAAERSRIHPSLREQRADVPWGLESILRKCLAPDPARRYQQAEHLAEDLHRFLDDRALKYAPELSRREQARKWARRHPRLTSAASVASVAALLLVASGLALATAIHRLGTAREGWNSAQRRERQEQFEQGTVRALYLVNTTLNVLGYDVQGYLRQGAAVCEETLTRYGLLDGEGWQEPEDWALLPADDRRRLAEDARELLLLLAAARLRLAPDDPAVLAQALALVDRAGAIPGIAPSRALWLDRADYLELGGRVVQARASRRRAAQIAVSSARDHYLLATSLARQGGPEDHARAIAELNRALQLNDRHYWSWAQRGLCYLELGELELAASDIGHCTGLWPEFAWGYYTLGYVHDRAGKKAEAIACYTSALARDEALTAAHINRGLVCLDLGLSAQAQDAQALNAQALNDFQRALLGQDEPPLHTFRGMALEALGRHAEADEAFREAFAHPEAVPAPTYVQMRWAYGFSVARCLPEEARGAFEEVLRRDAENSRALYGLAMLAIERGETSEALSYFDRALAADPRFIDARRNRAVLLARDGDLERASADINRCLEREPQEGETLYAAACVVALSSRRSTDSRLRDQALHLLQKALARGIIPERAQRDPDLEAIRRLPEFEQLLSEARGAGPIGPRPADDRGPRAHAL